MPRLIPNQPHPPMTNHDRIAAAVRTGLPDEVIAERLECSRRTVRRVRRKRDLERNENKNPAIWGTRSEWLLWRMWHRDVGESLVEVSHRFCRTRQAIHQGLRKLEAQEKVGGVPKRYPDAQSQ